MIYGDMHDRREVCSIRKTKRAYGIVYPMMLKGDLVSCRLQYGNMEMGYGEKGQSNFKTNRGRNFCI